MSSGKTDDPEVRVAYAIKTLREGIATALREVSPHERSQALLNAAALAMLHLGEDSIKLSDLVKQK